MIAKWIDIDGGKWRIVVNYDVTPDESVWVEKQLRSVNAYESDIEAALRLFTSQTGLVPSATLTSV